MYRAREQVDARTVSAATEPYPLALIMAELLVGHPWRQGLSISQIACDQMLYPLDASRLPAGLDPALCTALKRPLLSRRRIAKRRPSKLEVVAPPARRGSLRVAGFQSAIVRVELSIPGSGLIRIDRSG